MIFLHTILYMIILQTTFLHVYHLKDDICFCLNGSPNSHVYACAFQRQPCLRLLPTRARAPAFCVMDGRQRLLGDACLPTRTRALALCVTVYELARFGGLNQQTNGSRRFILNINTSPKEHLVFTISLRYSSSIRRPVTFSLALSEMALFSISHLHVHERHPSALWVVSSGSSATPVLLRINGC
jgi:hypothetical protein